ncbi:MAG: amidase [Candidatus Magnetomorum sp.]|nr:amidase [Candidatus Magnetomorum sp.]
MHSLFELSATRLAQMIRNQEVTSREVVETHIFRMKRINPRINAVVQTRFDEARNEARQADEIIMRGDIRNDQPFLGVPCTIKESFCLTGMANTGGLLSRKNCIARQDATAVARIKASGAIPLGVTNLSEICMWMESYNLVYGITRNPYGYNRTAGGSSGGEGSIIGSGASPFGLGSDIGGSIRMPAFFNGVFGHKPTAGLIPNSGHFPEEEEGISGISTTGPLCRRAEDLMPLLKILAGPDDIDPGCRTIPLQTVESVNIKNLTVYNCPIKPFIHVSPDLFAAQHQCVGALKKMGATIKDGIHIGNFKIVELWIAKLQSVSKTPFAQVLGNGKSVRPLESFFKWMMGKPAHTFPVLTMAIMDQLPYSKKRNQRLIQEIEDLKKFLTETIGAKGVMLFPSHPTTAPRHYMSLLTPYRWGYTGLFNILGFPVTQVPLGLNNHLLPTGIQIVGTPGNDHLTVAVAMELEKIFGGWVMP